MSSTLLASRTLLDMGGNVGWWLEPPLFNPNSAIVREEEHLGTNECGPFIHSHLYPLLMLLQSTSDEHDPSASIQQSSIGVMVF